MTKKRKAREWKAWATIGPRDRGGIKGVFVFNTKADAIEFRYDDEQIVPVRIVEIVK